jgi:hypothetical protein
LGINSISTEAINEYELGLRIRLASYWVGFSVIGSDPFCYLGAHPVDLWAMVAGCWAAWGVAGWAKPMGRLGFDPPGLGKYKIFFSFPNLL